MSMAYVYQLNWAKHSEAFVSIFRQLLKEESLFDCTLKTEGKNLEVHRIVLMACSPYLQEVLSKYTTQQHPIIDLEIKYSVLKSIISFCYEGEVTVPSEHLAEFVAAANELKISGISDKSDSDVAESATKDSDGDWENEAYGSDHPIDSAADGGDEQGSDSDGSDSSDPNLKALKKITRVTGLIETHPGSGTLTIPYDCSRCGDSFPTRTLHDAHRKICTRPRNHPWKCEKCANTYKNKKDLHRHLHVCGKSLPRYVCKCGSSYKYARGLKRHAKYCGKDLKYHECSDCGKRFKYRVGLQRHQIRCNVMETLSRLAENGVVVPSIKKKDDTEGPSQSDVDSGSETETRENCKKCGKHYVYRRSLQRHEEVCIFGNNSSKTIFKLEILDKPYT